MVSNIKPNLLMLSLAFTQDFEGHIDRDGLAFFSGGRGGGLGQHHTPLACIHFSARNTFNSASVHGVHGDTYICIIQGFQKSTPVFKNLNLLSDDNLVK